MTNTFPVRLVKSRFTISKENLETAMKRVHEGPEVMTGDAIQDCFNPIEPPTPWSGVKTLLERLGFKTRRAEDESIWISDFEEQHMTFYQFKILVNTLVNLSTDEPDSFIYLEKAKNPPSVKTTPYRIESGKLLNPDAAFHGTLKFEDFKVGKTPFHPLSS